LGNFSTCVYCTQGTQYDSSSVWRSAFGQLQHGSMGYTAECGDSQGMCCIIQHYTAILTRARQPDQTTSYSRMLVGWTIVAFCMVAGGEAWGGAITATVGRDKEGGHSCAHSCAALTPWCTCRPRAADRGRAKGGWMAVAGHAQLCLPPSLCITLYSPRLICFAPLSLCLAFLASGRRDVFR
jgi:hypothetical protein